MTTSNKPSKQYCTEIETDKIQYVAGGCACICVDWNDGIPLYHNRGYASSENACVTMCLRDGDMYYSCN